jgi:hypothetical protein
MVTIRTVGKALIFGILGLALMFFVGTFLGIVTLFTVGTIRHAETDLTISYRIIGLSTAAMGFFGGFLFAFIRDLRKS